jgi:hypothetical protein
MYGSVTNTYGGANSPLLAGTVNWTVSGNGSNVFVSGTIVNVNGQFFYIARVPFETRSLGGSPIFSATPNTLELLAPPGITYTRSATADGSNTVITASSRGTLASFPFSATDRGLVERVDLQVSLPGETFQQWALRIFGTTNVDPNADPDHDGMTNYQEYLAGTDPLDPHSVFMFVDIRPDALGGIDVRWQSATNKVYTLKRAGGLNQTFVNLQTHISATPGTNVVRDATATGSGPYFYWLLLE